MNAALNPGNDDATNDELIHWNTDAVGSLLETLKIAALTIRPRRKKTPPSEPPPSPAESAPTEIKPRQPEYERHAKINAIVAKYGEGWRKHLPKIVDELDTRAIRTPMVRGEKRRYSTWRDVLKSGKSPPENLIKLLERSIREVRKHNGRTHVS